MRPSSPTPGCFGGLFHRCRPSRSETAGPPKPSPAREGAVAEKPRFQLPAHMHANPCCDDYVPPPVRATEELPAYTSIRRAFDNKALKTIKSEIAALAPELKSLSLFMFDHPELGYAEYKAHDHLTAYLEGKEGVTVEKHFMLPTAFRATYTHGKGGRTFGLNSELDALPGVGHACGHPLIAAAGVGAFLGLKAAMEKHDIDGKVILLGTPAEEGGAGKVKLLEMGGYAGMDFCMMTHPRPGPVSSGSVAPSLAIQTINVEYFGKTSHAAGAPWDGINALDAANLAYSAISSMRQQLLPTDRIHGIITDGGQAPNIIPEHTQMRYFARATTVTALEALKKKILPCFEAAAKATGCEYKIWTDEMTNDLRNCKPMAYEYASILQAEFDAPINCVFGDWSLGGGSTDFGNITYAFPSCHPVFAIPSLPGRANHTPEFEHYARADVAHEEAWKSAVGLAGVGLRLLTEEEFAKEVKKSFDEDAEADK